MVAEMRSLSRRQRQQRGSTVAGPGGATPGLFGKGFAGLSDRRTQEPPDGGNVGRADGSGYQQYCGLLHAPEGARGGICDTTVQTGYQISATTGLGTSQESKE